MIIIAEPYVRFESTISSSGIEKNSKGLFEAIEAIIREHYREERDLDVYVEMRLERGSTKSWIAVVALANALIFYGSLRQSVDYLVQDAQLIAEKVLPIIQSNLGLSTEEPSTFERRLGVPGRLQRLFQAVERGSLNSDQATAQALSILADAGLPETESLLTQANIHKEFTSSEKHLPIYRQTIKGLPSAPLSPDHHKPSIAGPRKKGVIVKRDDTGRLDMEMY